MKKHIIKLIFSSLLLFSVFSGNSAARIIYVDDDASGANDGSSWKNAYNYLQDAIADAKWGLVVYGSSLEISSHESQDPNDEIEIRVAQGNYTPDKGGNAASEDCYASFELINGVIISGGYAGFAQDSIQDNPDARNIELYRTILSGDLLGNDSNEIDPNNLVNDPTFYDNSFHVVTGYYADETAILDGFTITGGNACGFDFDSTSRGGGIYIENGKPVIANCTFIINAAYEGGAIYNIISNPNIYNCKFLKNSANYYDPSSLDGGNGAAIYNAFSRPALKNCEFVENYASVNGGGIINDIFSKPELKNCIFTKNHATESGGAIYNTGYSDPNVFDCTFIGNSALSGGGCTNEESDSYFNNCTFIDNQAYQGGGFDNNYGNPVFKNCTFSNNKAGHHAGAIMNFLGAPVFRNCIFSGNFAIKSAGALWNTGGNLNLTNCTITGNYAQKSGSAVFNDTFIILLDTSQKIVTPGIIVFLNCIIWNSTGSISNADGSEIVINYCDLQNGKSSINSSVNDLTWGQGNIDAEPHFVKSGLWADVNDPKIIIEPNDPNALWYEGDYHHKSGAGHYDPNSKTWIIDDVNSPCIDAGDPKSPFANEPLPNGGRINMGAYGNTPQASKSAETNQILQQAIKESQIVSF